MQPGFLTYIPGIPPPILWKKITLYGIMLENRNLLAQGIKNEYGFYIICFGGMV